MGEHYATATYQPITTGDAASKNDDSAARMRPTHKNFAFRNDFVSAIVFVLVLLDGMFAAAVCRLLGDVSEKWLVAVLYSVGVVIVAQMCGLYSVRCCDDLRRSARNIFVLGIICVGIALGVLGMSGRSLAISHLPLALTAGFSLSVAARMVVGSVLPFAAERFIERVLLVGKSGPSKVLYGSSFMSQRHINIVGHIIVGDGDSNYPIVGRFSLGCDTASFNRTNVRIDRVAILGSDLSELELEAVLSGLDAVSCPIHLLKDLPSTNRSSNFGRYQTWILREAPIPPMVMLLKRVQDVAISALLLAITSPLLLLIAVLIRLDSQGPAIFRQARLGRDNQPFVVYKFRTMLVDAPGDDGSVQASRGDARVTRIGRVLRRTSLDELPQFFNVLEGTMSLVGPRPHPIALNTRFMTVVENYSARHRITPGITGWAQVNGSRGETSTIEQMQRRVDLDLEYLQHCSLFFDIWILLRTVISVLSLSDAY